MKQRVLFSMVAVCALAASSLPGLEPPENENYVGMNTNFVSDWSANNTFADIMLHARPWKNASWNGSVATDSKGWPLGDCSTVIFGEGNHTGTYKLVFVGQAEDINLMWIGGSVTNKQYNAAMNTTTADVNLTSVDTGGLSFTGTKRLPGDTGNTGIANVRLYRPGSPADGSSLLSTEYKALMDPFHVVRYMNWGETNVNPLETWAQRPRPGQVRTDEVVIDGRTGRLGQPIEYMVEASNELNADMWICLPVYADEEYMRKTAQVIRYGSDGAEPYTTGGWNDASKEFKGLNPDLKVYVEYGNEIWNTAGGFRTFGWTKEQSDAIRTDGVQDHPIEFDGESDQWTLLARYSAYRLVQASNAFRNVFGDASMNTRVRPVLMGQITGNWFNPRQLPWMEAFYGTERPASHAFPNPDPHPVSYYAYGAGGTAYYGVHNWSGNPDQFFAPSSFPTEDYDDLVAKEATMVMSYGLKRIAYEGGMGLDGGGGNLTNAQKQTLNSDPRMQDLTEAYHQVWSENGGDLLVYFVNVGALNWEFTWDVDVTDSPKMKAADALIGTDKATFTRGPTIPGVLVAREQDPFRYTSGSTFSRTIEGQPAIGGIDNGEWVGLAFNAPAEGTATLRLRLATTSSPKNARIGVQGIWEDSISVTGGQGNSIFIDTATVTVPVQAGYNVLRVAADGGSFNLHSVDFTEFTATDGNSVPSITTMSLPDAQIGAAYSQSFEAIGGNGTLNWSVVSGSLPEGLELDAAGQLDGTPSE